MNMKRNQIRTYSMIAIVTIGCSVLLLGARSASLSDGFNLNSIDFPNALSPQLQGINGGGAPGSLVFYSARDGHPNKQIYVMNPDGSDPLRVTYDAASDVDPDLSPDGQEIVFTSNQTGNNDIFVQDRSGAVRNLTNNPANDE
jgi:hypothetical protein